MRAEYVQSEMSYDEFVKWQLFFAQEPLGWREDYRTAKLLEAQGVKTPARQIFKSIGVILDKAAVKEKTREDGMLTAETLKGSTMFSKMLGAVGGDQLAVLNQI